MLMIFGGDVTCLEALIRNVFMMGKFWEAALSFFFLPEPLLDFDHKKAKCGEKWKIMLPFQFRSSCQNMQDLTRLEQFCPLI